MGNSFSSQMPLVAGPISEDSRSLCTYFISSWDDIQKKDSFVFHFQEDGRFCGIEISHFGDEDPQVFGERATGSGRNFTATVDAQSWITGLQFNVCNVGDLRADAVVGITGWSQCMIEPHFTGAILINVQLLVENGDDIQLGAWDGDKRQISSARKDHIITGTVGEIAVSHLHFSYSSLDKSQLTHVIRWRHPTIRSSTMSKNTLYALSFPF